MINTYAAPDDFANTIHKLYFAASNPGHWQPALAAMAKITGSSSACMPVSDAAIWQAEDLNYNVPGELQQEYSAQLHELDVLSPFARLNPDFATSTSQVFSVRPDLYVPEFEQRARYFGVSERWGANLADDVSIGLHRHHSLGTYGDDEHLQLAALLPHLRTAVDIYQRLQHSENQRNGLLQCIGELGMGVILLDSRGNVCLVNARARMLMRDTGLLDVRASQLVSTDTTVNTQLQQAMASILAGEKTRRGLRLGAGKHTPELCVACFVGTGENRADEPSTAPGVAIFISEPEHSIDIDLPLLRELYALTEAEAETLLLLANDYSVAELAQLRRVHISTARSQVQALREKTGCTRQSGLVKLVMNSTARLHNT